MIYKSFEKEIPEGYEARIEGNKVVFEPKKNEDERIERDILKTLRYGLASEESALMPGAKTTLKEAIAYLEKQKEQKSEIKYVYPIFKVGDIIRLKAYNESHRINKIKDDNYVLDNGFIFPIVGQDMWEIVEQKPAEWSEGEMKVLDSIIDDYEKASKSFCGYDGKVMLLKAIRDGKYDLSKREWSEEDEHYFQNLIMAVDSTFSEGNTKNWLLNRFKSLRPQPH